MQTNSFIQHLLSNVNLDSDRVIEFAESFCGGNTEDMMRIMSYLSGFSSRPEVPETSTVRKDATLISYDFFADRVEYKYITTREYRVSEEYKDLNTVFDSWNDIPREVRKDSGDYKITVQYYTIDSCSLERWLDKD